MSSTRVMVVALALGLVVAGIGAPPVEGALVAYYALDGNANDPVGGFNGTVNGGATYVPSPVSGLAIDLNGSPQYISTAALASALGIGGNNAKTITAWARTEAYDNGGIWDIGANAAQQEYGLRTLTTTNGYRGQFWSGDLDVTAPGASNNWSHFAMTHDGSTTTIYHNGIRVGSRSATLATSDGYAFQVGRYAGSTYFQGQVDEVRVYNNAMTANDVAKQYTAEGGYAEGFDGSNALPADWYVSSGMNSTRVRTNRGGDSGRLLSTFDNDANDPAGNVRNVYAVHQDNVTSQTFGSILVVRDDTESLSFKLAGGGFAIVEGSQRAGGLGVALWDIEANDYVRDSGVIRSAIGSLNGSLQAQTLSLAGLQGKKVMPVLIDRQIGGSGWVELDSINARVGAVQVMGSSIHHRVRLDYHFDNPGDFMGWWQEGVAGTPTDFQLGRVGSGGLLARHINLDPAGGFNVGEGFLSSTTFAAGAETPTGILRSPDFIVDGDILEFYVSGGSTDDMAFELVRSVDDVVLRTAGHQASANEFDYEFWTIGDLFGTEAYLRLIDNRSSGGWGHLEIDGIRMLQFDVPEPGTLTLVGLGLLGLARRRRRR